MILRNIYCRGLYLDLDICMYIYWIQKNAQLVKIYCCYFWGTVLILSVSTFLSRLFMLTDGVSRVIQGAFALFGAIFPEAKSNGC